MENNSSTTGLLTSVQNLCRIVYDHSCAAVSKIDVNKLNQHLPDQEARSRLATDFAKNAVGIALEEVSKSVPGGHLLYRIATKSLDDVKK